MIDAYINAVIDAYATELILQPATSTSVLKNMPSNVLFSYHPCIVILLIFLSVNDSVHSAARLV